MDSSTGEAFKANKPVRTVKLPKVSDRRFGDTAAGPGCTQEQTQSNLGSSFAAVNVKSSTQSYNHTSDSPYSRPPVNLGPPRRVRSPRLAHSLEETYQAKILVTRDTSPSTSPTSPSPRKPPMPSQTPRGLAMMGVTLSEAMMQSGHLLRDEKLCEAYNEAAHQRGVLSKHRRQLIKDVGKDNRLKAQRHEKRARAERKQWQENCESDDKLREVVASIVPPNLLKESKFFSYKRKPRQTKRLSVGTLMLAMIEHEEDAQSDASTDLDDDDHKRESYTHRPSMSKRMSSMSEDSRGPNLESPCASRSGSKSGSGSVKAAKPRVTLVSSSSLDGKELDTHELQLKLKTSKEARMEKLGSLMNEASGAKKMMRLLRARTSQFEALPASERESLKKAFEKHDKDGGGTLDSSELKRALNELGLKPQRDLEKQEIAMIVQECMCLGDVDFFNFCFDLVPRVRKLLKDLREGPMREMFNKYDQDASGYLDREECREIFRGICGTNLDIQSRLELMNSFNELHPQVCMDNSDEVDFKGFQKLISQLEERVGRLRSSRERFILEKYDIPKTLLNKHQDELITLHETFSRADADDSGELTEGEVKTVLREYNLMPRDTWEQERIVAIIQSCDDNGDGEMSFPEFLQLVSKLREEALLRMKSEIRRVFDKYDRDNSGSLDVKEVSAIFTDLGIEPKCRQDQDEIKRLLDEVDEDGNGEFDFDEFVILFQRVTQRLHAVHRRREQEVAMDLGYTNDQVLEMREAFWELDHDHNNELTLNEARRVVVILRKQLTDDELTQIYLQMERNAEGNLEFIGFMQMMKYMEDPKKPKKYMEEPDV